MPNLHARLFGGLEFCDADGGELKLATRKARALLAYLVVEPGRWHTRERLAGLLWSDRQQAQARHSLTQALGTIRKLGERADLELIETNADRVRLIGEAVDTDVIKFRASAGSDPTTAAKLCQGMFLDGFVSGDALFDEWAEAERSALHQQTYSVLEAASSQLSESGDANGARALALRWVALEPLSEAAHRQLMRLLVEAGDRAGAVQQYQTCERLLLDELGVGPSTETLGLLGWIKTGPVTVAPPRRPNELPTSGDPGPQREQFNEQFLSSSSKTGKVRRTIDADRPSIAVLPFANLSPDPDQEFFADGLADDIINTLSKISRMRVIARHSTFAYKGRQLDVRAIAGDLGVRYVLEGSVRRAGDRLRVTAQLVETQSGSPLWAERFDRQVEDLFDIQDEITKEVVTALQVELTVGEEARVWSRGTNSIEAWQHCVQAIECQYRLTATHHLQARKLAEKALELDPNYAYAWGVLGFSYYREARLDVSGDRLDRLERAAEIAEKAMSLDSSASWVVGLRAATTAALGVYFQEVVGTIR